MKQTSFKHIQNISGTTEVTLQGKPVKFSTEVVVYKLQVMYLDGEWFDKLLQ